MKHNLTLNEIRLINEMSNDTGLLLSEGILSDVMTKIKKAFSSDEKEEIAQKISENLGVDENSSREEIEEKLMEITDGKPSLLKRVLKEILGFGSLVLVDRIEAIIGGLLIHATDYNPIVIASVVMYVILSQTHGFRKMRRKVLGKKTDEFIFGKNSRVDKDTENENLKENKKVIRLSESDLVRLIKRIIKES